MNYTLHIKAVNKYKHKPNTDNREFKELDFGTTPQKLQEEYMDIYEGIHSEIVSSSSTPLFTKICFKNTKNTSWKWSMC